MGKEIRLPWPSSKLSPNSRTDRRWTTKERQAIKAEWWAVARAARFPACDHLDITFCPPDARKRDLDNCLGSIKYGLDGLAKAAGQDDSDWALTIRMGDPVRPGGEVIVRPLFTDVHVPIVVIVDGQGNVRGGGLDG